MAPVYLREWQRKQKRRRDELVQESIDIEIERLSGTDIHNDETRLRAQAYAEKLEMRRKYDPKLEEQMEELLRDKLGPGWNSGELGISSAGSAAQSSPTHTGRGLRLSTVRQQQKSNLRHPEAASRKSLSNSSSIPDPVVSRPRPAPRTSKSLPADTPSTSIWSSSQLPAVPLQQPIRKRKLFEVEGSGSGSGSSRYP